MFEITVIEKFPSGGLVMSHIPCDDDAVDAYSEELAVNENECVKNGLILSYTVIAVYAPNNRAQFYAQPSNIGVRP